MPLTGQCLANVAIVSGGVYLVKFFTRCPLHVFLQIQIRSLACKHAIAPLHLYATPPMRSLYLDKAGSARGGWSDCIYDGLKSALSHTVSRRCVHMDTRNPLPVILQQPRSTTILGKPEIYPYFLRSKGIYLSGSSPASWLPRSCSRLL